MKKRSWQVIRFLAALLAASTAFGQYNRGETVTSIPFGFTVANHFLPPGRYTIAPLSDTTLRIFNVHHQGAIILTHEIEGKAERSAARIVFHHYGDSYFLSEVWPAASSTGRKTFPTSAERELAATETESELAVLQIGRQPASEPNGPTARKKHRDGEPILPDFPNL